MRGRSLLTSSEDSPKSGMFNDPRGVTSIKTEECVDLSPLLFDNSDELFNKVDSIESSCDTVQKGIFNYYFINKEDTYENAVPNTITYTPDNLSAAPSPSSILDSKMEDDFFNSQALSAENTVDILGLGLVGNVAPDNYSIFNSSVYNNVMISDLKDTDRVLFDTPENSNSPSGFTRNKRGLPSLPLTLLDLTAQVPTNFIEEINTPDIINCIIENEKLDFCKRTPKQLTFTNLVAEEIPSTSSSFVEIDDYQSFPASGKSSPVPIRSTGKGKKRYVSDDSEDEFLDDDNDKDYVPPAKIPRKSGKNWSALEGENLLRLGRRGRPPKRAKSISSDDYSQLDPDEAKYREMRDRNNEASRKSRYKRKQKEIKMTDELDDLEHENVKLKVQVEELQKTVEKYRENLMKVMLSKK